MLSFGDGPLQQLVLHHAGPVRLVSVRQAKPHLGIEQLKPGDFVKIGLDGFHPAYSTANQPEEHRGGEQFWVQVVSIGLGCVGVLQNELKNYILRKGILIEFERRNILDILTLEDYESLP